MDLPSTTPSVIAALCIIPLTMVAMLPKAPWGYYSSYHSLTSFEDEQNRIHDKLDRRFNAKCLSMTEWWCGYAKEFFADSASINAAHQLMEADKWHRQLAHSVWLRMIRRGLADDLTYLAFLERAVADKQTYFLQNLIDWSPTLPTKLLVAYLERNGLTNLRIHYHPLLYEAMKEVRDVREYLRVVVEDASACLFSNNVLNHPRSVQSASLDESPKVFRLKLLCLLRYYSKEEAALRVTGIGNDESRQVRDFIFSKFK